MSVAAIAALRQANHADNKHEAARGLSVAVGLHSFGECSRSEAKSFGSVLRIAAALSVPSVKH